MPLTLLVCDSRNGEAAGFEIKMGWAFIRSLIFSELLQVCGFPNRQVFPSDRRRIIPGDLPLEMGWCFSFDCPVQAYRAETPERCSRPGLTAASRSRGRFPRGGSG